MPMSLPESSLEQLFVSARTHNRFRPDPVPPAMLRTLYELMKWGPTSANCSPARLVFVTSAEAKARLAPCMSEANRAKTVAAPVNVIVGMDMTFYERLPELFPHQPAARGWFEGQPELIAATALRNASLQGAYMILAARALGLDCGPMSGFDAEAVNAAFFAGGSVRVNFICNLGWGDPSGLHPRGPRLSFEQACTIV